MPLTLFSPCRYRFLPLLLQLCSLLASFFLTVSHLATTLSSPRSLNIPFARLLITLRNQHRHFHRG